MAIDYGYRKGNQACRKHIYMALVDRSQMDTPTSTHPRLKLYKYHNLAFIPSFCSASAATFAAMCDS
jgi:hypothetical protein